MRAGGIAIRAAAEVELDIDGAATTRAVLDAIEARYSMLRGTIRDAVAGG